MPLSRFLALVNFGEVTGLMFTALETAAELADLLGAASTFPRAAEAVLGGEPRSSCWLQGWACCRCLTAGLLPRDCLQSFFFSSLLALGLLALLDCFSFFCSQAAAGAAAMGRLEKEMVSPAGRCSMAILAH